MRNISLIVVACSLLIGCSKKENEGNLQITGQVKGLRMGTLYIQKIQDTAFVLLDSIAVSGDATFSSNLTIDSPEMLYLFIDRGQTKTIDNNLMFFAEPGKINIDTNLEKFYASAKIKGSKNHDLYEEYKKVKSRFIGQELDLTEKRIAAIRSKQPFSETDNQAQLDAIIKKRYLYAINFAINNKDREIAPYIALAEINDANVTFLDTIYKSLTPKVASSKYGVMLQKYVIERKTSEGK